MMFRVPWPVSILRCRDGSLYTGINNGLPRRLKACLLPHLGPGSPQVLRVCGSKGVYTAAYHLKRGYCCGSGCRHCPFEPRHVEGNTKVPI